MLVRCVRGGVCAGLVVNRSDEPPVVAEVAPILRRYARVGSDAREAWRALARAGYDLAPVEVR